MCNYGKAHFDYSTDINIDNKIDDFKNQINEELLKVLLELISLPSSEIPNIHPYLLLWIERQLQSNNNLDEFIVEEDLIDSLNDNIYNFALAKQSKLLEGFKTIDKAETLKEDLKMSYAKLILETHMDVENHHVSKNTKNINNIVQYDMLEYVSERDSRVRKEHEKADGTIRDSKDAFWKTAMKLQGEWNCRCEILPAKSGAKMTTVPKVEVKSGDEQPSDVNLEEGKAILFKESLDVFSNAPLQVRRRYRKNGF